ncbi:hypothetical protein FSP39_015825 [Pinctada imbricata]|uniref:Uncharacterized protein n=1 Tax=Pinctada imbricata TaxID=66713 RepID=A0AA89C3Z3_PINIB|nr:hypothetical protein FSP39_015825 [Pinctada imbricata]
MKYFVPSRIVKGVNCGRLFAGDKNEIGLARTLMKNYSVSKSPEEYIEDAKDCPSYIEKNMFIMSSLTDEELNFPLAYSILLYKDVSQFEILLRAIYRPQNFYCVHVDLKSEKNIYDAVSGIAGCFDNVIMTSERFNVSWGKYSILEPEFSCMKQLLKYKKWKYFINLTGQEYPLRTNAELVKILGAFNLANDVEGTVKR